MKWVCVTNNFENFTYGNIYEGERKGSLLNIPNDKNEFVMPALFGYIPEYVEYFITYEKWEKIRKEKSEKIATEFWNSLKSFYND